MSFPEGIKAINLGCGTSIAPGWINLDNSPNARLAKVPALRWLLWKVGILSEAQYRIPWSKSIIIRDLRKPLPFGDNSIDYVYTSHFLEHNTRQAARKLLCEVHRVLKPGGIARIVVPDLASGARRYVEALNHNPNDANAAAEFLQWMQLLRVDVRDPHLWMYDAPSLTALLNQVGLVNVLICKYQKGRVPDCEVLDNRPEESLYLEAEKPG
ncbi:MAG: methyltransferase domain-containing protein [Acidobacteriota bacterium]